MPYLVTKISSETCNHTNNLETTYKRANSHLEHCDSELFTTHIFFRYTHMKNSIWKDYVRIYSCIGDIVVAKCDVRRWYLFLMTLQIQASHQNMREIFYFIYFFKYLKNEKAYIDYNIVIYQYFVGSLVFGCVNFFEWQPGQKLCLHNFHLHVSLHYHN